jgi:hypothetical protein
MTAARKDELFKTAIGAEGAEARVVMLKAELEAETPTRFIAFTLTAYLTPDFKPDT